LVSMLVMAVIQTEWAFLTGGIVYGLSAGVISPTIFAWTADLATDNHRGKAMSTLFLALEIGIFLGAISSGYLYNNDPGRFMITFLTGACFSALSLIFIFKWSPPKSPVAAS
jgi:MFS family permease